MFGIPHAFRERAGPTQLDRSYRYRVPCHLSMTVTVLAASVKRVEIRRAAALFEFLTTSARARLITPDLRLWSDISFRVTAITSRIAMRNLATEESRITHHTQQPVRRRSQRRPGG